VAERCTILCKILCYGSTEPAPSQGEFRHVFYIFESALLKFSHNLSRITDFQTVKSLVCSAPLYILRYDSMKSDKSSQMF
jgi:hypothetical protein